VGQAFSLPRPLAGVFFHGAFVLRSAERRLAATCSAMRTTMSIGIGLVTQCVP